MPIQKVFLLPPLKGLNLYDNPFTMSQDFAVDLTNFMPPTTTFTVRPGVERLLDLNGQVKGIYSYTTGSVMDYGENWYNSNISYGAASLLLVKLTQTDGTTKLVSVNVSTKEIQEIGTLSNSYYNDDSAMVKHTMFFASGASDSAAYLYHQAKGLGSFSLSIGADGHQTVGNISNIVVFKDYIFFSTPGSSNVTLDNPDPDGDPIPSDNSLNIFFIKKMYADILDPLNSQFWKKVENLFSPHFASAFSLDGVIQNGGNIIKMCNISRSGSNTVSTYLAIITDQGEIVLFDGTDPTDTKGEKWQVIGKFQIPPPLNKWAFSDMEGDLVVVTKNGLVSLRRVVFGQATAITENLENRLMSLFKDYMFQIPSFSQFVGLFYHQRNRLLIFNVPTDLPMPFNMIVTSYNFDKNKSLVFGAMDDSFQDQLLQFVKEYVVKNCLNYNLVIEFNSDFTNSKIELGFVGDATTVDPSTNIRSAKITFDIYIKEVAGDKNFSFLNKAVVFNVENIDDESSPVTIADDTPLAWSSELHNTKQDQYIYTFKHDGLTVTNILPSSSLFYVRPFAVTLAQYALSETISDYGRATISSFYYNLLPNMFKVKIYDLQKTFEAGDVHDFTTSSHFDSFFYDDTASNACPQRLIFYMSAAALLSISDAQGNYPSCDITYTYPLYLLMEDDTKIPIPLTITLHHYKGTSDTDPSTINYDINFGGFYSISLEYGTPCYSYYEGTETDGIVDISEGAGGSIPQIVVTMNPSPPVIDFTKKSGMLGVELGVSAWSMSSLSGDDQAALLPHLEVILPNDPSTLDFKNYFSWLYSNVALDLDDPLESSKSSNPISVNPPYPTHLTNVDLTSIPILSKIDITCDFASTQYVFDSHFGTWSSFKNVNMVRGIEHQNDFYFIVPDNISYNSSSGTPSYVITSSTLCRFNPAQLGDMVSTDPDASKIAIECGYKTVSTWDFGVASKKIFKRIKVFGTPSVFWQIEEQSTPPSYPLVITPFWDLKKGAESRFIHAFDGNSMTEKILKKHFKGKKHHELDFIENRKFWELYKEENDMLTQVSIPLIANPGTRFGLQIDMTMTEAYMDIYGFEIFFEPTPQIL
jgi:hypothetical protein